MRGVMIAAGLSVGLLLAACGGSSEPAEPTATPTPEKERVTGTVTLHGRAARQPGEAFRLLAGATWDEPAVPGEECSGYGGFDDLRAGMEVRLEADGKILSLGRLSDGEFADWQEAEGRRYEMSCIFEFKLDVPAGHDFYTLALGRRGEHTYTYDELTSSGALAYEVGR